MKIRTDFVTNSSSTCFVVIHKGELTLDKFIKAVGLTPDSIYKDIYRELFASFAGDLAPIREFAGHDNVESFDDYIKRLFSRETLDKIFRAEEMGYNVSGGRLSNDHGYIEDFFCTDSFLIESEDLFIDATDDGW